MYNVVDDLLAKVTYQLWDNFLIYVLVISAVFFTTSFKLIQIRDFVKSFRLMLKGSDTSGVGITSFQAFCTSLAARIGTGNIVGVGIAIYLGGPGAVFWMWLLAFLGMATSFVEGTLAQLYKVKDGDSGLYRGGPSYYIKTGLGSAFWAKVFAIALIFTYTFAFNGFQAHSIGEALNHTFGLPQYVAGIALCVLEAAIIMGGIKKIAKAASLVVPIVSLIYLGMALVVIAMSWQHIPSVFHLIVSSAFGLKTAASGCLGYTVQNAMVHGVRRGLFSNEAGMGSAPNIAAAAHTDHPVTQGYMQMLGPFFDTIVVCTCTALIVLFSGQFVPGSGVTGVQLVQDSLSAKIGPMGGVFVALSLTCFATMTMLGNYSYSEMSLCFIFPKITRGLLTLFRAVSVLVIAVAPNLSLSFVMNLSDLTMGIMTVINLSAILLLSGEAKLLVKDYAKSLSSGEKNPKFSLKQYDKLAGKVNSSVW